MDTANHGLDFTKTTLAYYEAWLGASGCLSSGEGVRFMYSQERGTAQAGYPERFDIIVWLDNRRAIFSYGDRVCGKIGELKARTGDARDIAVVSSVLMEMFDCNLTHNIEFVYEGQAPASQIEAKTLAAQDYPDYKTFFTACYPDSETDWLKGYFDEMTQFGYCVGAYADGVIAACTDAPAMPYLPQDIQHIGITTLQEYRGRGYAAAACKQAVQNVIKSGKTPQWTCEHTNIASRKLAEGVGFVKLADMLMLTLRA